MEEETSKIQKFFEGKCIFITGGTGFLGHLLIQKLIRDCPGITKIYLLIRPKKGKTSEQRLQDMFQDVVFDKMKTACPNYLNIIEMFEGDLEQPDLGLKEKQTKILSEEVNIIFHLAATLSFDEKIRRAAQINILATRDLLKLAKSAKNLKAFVYCSTAYSNCPRKVIYETFYDMPIQCDKFLELLEHLNDEQLHILTPNLLNGWPNTYSFTKGLVENIIKEEAKDLPITIVRPSIIVSTVDDPVEGWINNLHGFVGFTAGTGLGVLRVIRADKKCIFDCIPGDYVTHNLIVASEYAATSFERKKLNSSENLEAIGQTEFGDGIPIFNVVSCQEKPVTLGELISLGFKSEMWTPKEALWKPFLIVNRNEMVANILQFLLHNIPAYLIDFGLYFKGKKTRMVKLTERINKASRLFSYFTMKEWDFKNDKNKALWNNLNKKDKQLFKFSMEDFDWEKYFLTQFAEGIYLYIYKNKMEDLGKSQARTKKLKLLHSTIIFIFYTICAYLIFCIFTKFIEN